MEKSEWKFAQCFGDKNDIQAMTEGEFLIPCSFSFSFAILILADLITTVEFDLTGDFLASGDKGGRIVLFERNSLVPLPNNVEKGLRVSFLYRVSIS